VEYVHVESADYDERFLRCVELVQQLLAADSLRGSRTSYTEDKLKISLME
ncbi:multifunctional transcriptional regulator/nicotinamide-nucleotide adenylyltransferase/ribosylnicotinamide kinase NadR, partial [Vibrio sp. A14(2019)]|nr:multifunctional transcriptional regulator/nicotinamide-nucleotide adenylyltransferase/ribosylnicotinamide kinase NadR [Vibrio sp. A14(2019)]